MAIAVFTIKYHTPSFTIIYNVYNDIYVHTVSRLQYHWLLSMYGHHRCLEDVRLSRVDQQIDRWPGPAGPAGSLVWGRRTACRLFSSRDNICPLYTNQMIIVTLHKPKPTFGTHSKAWLRIASSAPPPQAPFHPSKADCGYVRHSPLVRFARHGDQWTTKKASKRSKWNIFKQATTPFTSLSDTLSNPCGWNFACPPFGRFEADERQRQCIPRRSECRPVRSKMAWCRPIETSCHSFVPKMLALGKLHKSSRSLFLEGLQSESFHQETTATKSTLVHIKRCWVSKPQATRMQFLGRSF